MFLKLVFKRKEMCMSVIFQAKINLMLVDKHSQIPILALKTPNLLVLHLNAEDQFWPWTVTGDLVQCADFLWAEDSIIRFHTINRDGNIFWGKQNNFSTNNAASKSMAWMNEWMNEWMNVILCISWYRIILRTISAIFEKRVTHWPTDGQSLL